MSTPLDQEQLANLLEEAESVPLMGTDTEEFLVWSARLDEAADSCEDANLAEAARYKAAWFRHKYELAEQYFRS